MLSHDEQRAWDEIRRPPSSKPVGLPAAVVAGGCIAVLLIIFGAPVAGLAIAVATVPRWLLWRYWPLLDGGVRPSAPTAPRDVPLDGEGHPLLEEPGHGRTPGTA
jgi:hypothetical protein